MFDVLGYFVGSLDSLPSSGRAMLSAAVLAALVYSSSRKIPAARPGLGVSYRKTSLLALLAVPLIVYSIPSWRFVVSVEEMPVIDTLPSAVWWTLLSAWLVGVVVALADVVRCMLVTGRDVASLEAVDEKLGRRLEIWRGRMDIERGVRMGLGESPTPWSAGWWRPAIVLPRGARHWPQAVQDAAIVHELAHLQRHHWLWLLFGGSVAALYWPIPWIGRLSREMAAAFQQTSDSLAMHYFRDHLGYARALRHIKQRMESESAQAAAAPVRHDVRLVWGDAGSLEIRKHHARDADYVEPFYDRVFWALAQTAFAVFLLTATTLEEIREAPDERLMFAEQETWQLSFSGSSRYEEIGIRLETTR